MGMVRCNGCGGSGRHAVRGTEDGANSFILPGTDREQDPKGKKGEFLPPERRVLCSRCSGRDKGCPACGGSGILMTVCSKCGGKGSVFVKQDYHRDNHRQPEDARRPASDSEKADLAATLNGSGH